jgi:hypothetical protein
MRAKTLAECVGRRRRASRALCESPSTSISLAPSTSSASPTTAASFAMVDFNHASTAPFAGEAGEKAPW